MHDISCISFGELLSGVDLIKELASRTKSRRETVLLGDEVEARRILEELVQLHNIGMVLVLACVTS